MRKLLARFERQVFSLAALIGWAIDGNRHGPKQYKKTSAG
jgi:hypothetical protein